MVKFNSEEGEVKVESFSSVCDDERRRRGERERRAPPAAAVEQPAAAAPSPSGNVTVPLPPAHTGLRDHNNYLANFPKSLKMHFKLQCI